MNIKEDICGEANLFNESQNMVILLRILLYIGTTISLRIGVVTVGPITAVIGYFAYWDEL